MRSLPWARWGSAPKAITLHFPGGPFFLTHNFVTSLGSMGPNSSVQEQVTRIDTKL